MRAWWLLRKRRTSHQLTQAVNDVIGRTGTQQAQALETPAAIPARVVNPRTNETFVLLRAEEYERLMAEEYDDSPWTREELEAAAWEAGERAGWDEHEPIAGAAVRESS
jgi:hypothetical protein